MEFFVGTEKDPVDLLNETEKEKLIRSVAPDQLPAGRWAENPGFSMSLMQQYAINKCLRLSPGQLYSVNGPPGTGKTTLLKDIIAQICVERAKVLSQLTNPLDAFIKEPVKNASDSTYIFPLISELKGFEVVVASSNNAAVENISKDLYLYESVHSSYHDFFCLLPEVNKNFRSHEKDPQNTWGLFSLAMGKNSNIKSNLKKNRNLSKAYFRVT